MREKIANDLRARIADGRLKPGDQLPSEAEIMRDHETSQTTARAAISLLRNEGLISVERGRRATVRNAKPILRDATARLSAEQWGAGHAIWAKDVNLRSMSIGPVDVRHETAPEDVAKLLGADAVVVRDRVYSVEGRQVQWALSYLPADLVAGSPIERPDTGMGGTYARLRDLGVEPAKFVEQVRVRMPRPLERERLGLGAGQPVAVIRRTAATANGRVVEVNDMVLVGDAYVMQWSFTS